MYLSNLKMRWFSFTHFSHCLLHTQSKERCLKDKVIVVTGGATGIGFEMADKYLQEGAKAASLLDTKEQEGTEAVKTLNTKYGNNKASFFKCDVSTDLEAVSKKVIDKYKQIDVLVNNAGILNDAAVLKTIDINIKGVITWSLKFREHMRKDCGGKGGTIINLSSIYGFRVAQFFPVYQSSKFAIMGFTRCLGHKYHYDRTGVRIIAICPGFTETWMTANPKMLEDQMIPDLNEYLKKQAWQKVDAVGTAAVEAFERADSGTAWLSEGGKPTTEVR